MGERDTAAGSAVDRLGRWPLFRDLNPATLGDLVVLMHAERYDAGQLVLLEGERSSSLLLLSRGHATHSQLSPEGREHVLSYLGPGRFLNLVPTLDGLPQPGSVNAATAMEVLAMPGRRFLDLVAGRADLGLAVARQLAHDVRALGETARGLALDPVRKRLAAFLLASAEVEPPQQRWTQDLIAARIGTVRDVVGRILRDMVQEGLVARQQGRLVITDRDRLVEEARTGAS